MYHSAMKRTIPYYLSVMSIWSCIGHEAIVAVARANGVAFEYKPVTLSKLFGATGGTPLRQRHLARQRYRDFELQRWCARRNVQLNLRSKFLTVDPTLADGAIIAAQLLGHDPEPYLRGALHAVWMAAQDVSDPAVVRALLDGAGLPAQAILDGCATEQVARIYASNLADAERMNVFGTPSFVVDGEVFWGQDRLDFLDEALRSNRPPYQATV